MFMFIYYHAQSVSEEVTERERRRETQNPNEAGPRLWAGSTEPEVGLEPMNHEIMT